MNHQHQYTVEKIRKAKTVASSEGAEVTINRVFPTTAAASFDPFVLLDEFMISPPGGFPTHSHKGFEGITYMIDGSIHHTDILRNRETIAEGDVQRFTAGRGIEHTEKAVGNGVNRGLQLWVNLPEEEKQVIASYQHLEKKDLPYQDTKAAFITEVAGGHSPLKLHTKVVFKDVTLAPNSSVTLDIPENYNAFIYVLTEINGSVNLMRATHQKWNETTENDDAVNTDLIIDTVIEPGEVLLMEHLEKVTLQTKEQASRFVFIAGKPLNQPIVLRGNNVE